MAKSAKPAKPAKPARASTAVYQLKVTLMGSKPPIWRRFLVPGSISLGGLHSILLAVMGWHGGHMHKFDAPDGTQYGEPEPEHDYHVANEAKARLDKVLPQVKDQMLYMYDFGDSWEHKIVVEKILPSGDGLDVPSCLAGKRACPPDDCGGVWGYVDFLETIGDKAHPEHESMLEWIDGEFDPEHFDPAEVNARFVARRRG